MQNIEEAGIHSGNSAWVLPPFKATSDTIEEIIKVTKELSRALSVLGLINLQFAYRDRQVYILEVNPRASRTVPFVSKATNVPLARIAAQLMMGKKLSEFQLPEWDDNQHIAVKEAVLPFDKFTNETIFLGPEMKATGEVMGISNLFSDAYNRAVLGTGYQLPQSGTVFISVNDRDKLEIIPIARDFQEIGFKIVATAGTGRELRRNGITAEILLKVDEGQPNVTDRLKDNQVQLIINTPLGQQARFDKGAIGKVAREKKVLVITTLSGAQAAVRAIRTGQITEVKPLQEYHRTAFGRYRP